MKVKLTVEITADVEIDNDEVDLDDICINIDSETSIFSIETINEDSTQFNLLDYETTAVNEVFEKEP